MLTRKELTNVVIWPASAKGELSIVNSDGEIKGVMSLTAPMRGIDLMKLIPEDHKIKLKNVSIIKTTGELVIGKKIEFDTVVKTERPEVSIEQRLARLERREEIKRRRMSADLKELGRLKKMEADGELDPPEPLIEEEPPLHADDKALLKDKEAKPEGIS